MSVGLRIPGQQMTSKWYYTTRNKNLKGIEKSEELKRKRGLPPLNQNDARWVGPCRSRARIRDIQPQNHFSTSYTQTFSMP